MKTTTKSSGRMHSPAHPGEILKTMYMDPLDVTVTKAADALGVTRKHLSAIVNGHSPVTPDMAVRLAGVFGTEPEIWINLQAQYDLWIVSRQSPPKVKRLAEGGVETRPTQIVRPVAGRTSVSAVHTTRRSEAEPR